MLKELSVNKEQILKDIDDCISEGKAIMSYSFYYAVKDLIEEMDTVEYALKVLKENGWKEERYIREGM